MSTLTWPFIPQKCQPSLKKTQNSLLGESICFCVKANGQKTEKVSDFWMENARFLFLARYDVLSDCMTELSSVA